MDVQRKVELIKKRITIYGRLEGQQINRTINRLSIIEIKYKKNNDIFGRVSVTMEQLSNILHSISAGKAICLDELHAVIKDVFSIVAKRLTYIIFI